MEEKVSLEEGIVSYSLEPTGKCVLGGSHRPVKRKVVKVKVTEKGRQQREVFSLLCQKCGVFLEKGEDTEK